MSTKICKKHNIAMLIYFNPFNDKVLLKCPACSREQANKRNYTTVKENAMDEIRRMKRHFAQEMNFEKKRISDAKECVRTLTQEEAKELFDNEVEYRKRNNMKLYDDEV